MAEKDRKYVLTYRRTYVGGIRNGLSYVCRYVVGSESKAKEYVESAKKAATGVCNITDVFVVGM